MSFDDDLRYGLKSTQHMIDLLERDLKVEYSKALNQLNYELSKYYGKYEMTYQEMNKYNRLKGLMKEIDAQVRGLSGNLNSVMRDGLGRIYSETYYRTAYAMEKGVQAKLAYTMIDPKVITASIQNPISGLTLNERLRERQREVIIRIKSSITQGLIAGDSYKDMADRIRHGVDMEVSKSVRIARTEGHRCQQIGRRESLEHAENQGVVGHYVWNSALDGSTRDSHRSMDGVHAGKDGYFTLPGGARTKAPGLSGDPSEDINCRCDVIYQIEGFEPTVRRIRGEGVVPYKTYNEWYKKRLVG
jgi:uncharacterized protein with gpF-like domain